MRDPGKYQATDGVLQTSDGQGTGGGDDSSTEVHIQVQVDMAGDKLLGITERARVGHDC